MTRSYIPVLSVAGSDSSGGAGIQADIKTISALGCYAMTAITAITVQNTTGVEAVDGVDPLTVVRQIEAVASDIPPMAVKTGMLYSSATVVAVADTLRRLKLPNVVVDPVMISTSGSILLKGDNVLAAVRSRLIPAATLLTPNVHESAVIAATRNPHLQLSEIHSMGCPNVLLKGGDAPASDLRTDILSLDWGRRVVEISSPTVVTPNTHGTGCTLSAAIAALLARGLGLEHAVRSAKDYIFAALAAGADVTTGAGHGPVNHFFSPQSQIIQHTES